MKPKIDTTEMDSNSQVEAELKRTKKELEYTKNALKHQVARCRHLVSAFSKKLAEKDAELKVCRETREKQLNAMIRALLVLEARLRREQKCIQTMLVERDKMIDQQREELARLGVDSDTKEEVTIVEDKDDHLCVLLAAPEEFAELPLESALAERDAIIATQQSQIAELRSLLGARKPDDPCYAQPDLISSLRIDDAATKSESGTETAETAAQPDSLSSDAASTRACLGDADSDSLCNCTITPPVVRGGLSVHDRSAFSPVPRSAPKFEETPSFVHDDSYETQPLKTPKKSFDVNYQDNPVLQCVNQILLKDPDDIMEDQRSNKLPSIESPFVETDEADQQFWLTNSEELTLEESSPSSTENLQPVATSSPSEKHSSPETESHRGVPRISLAKLIELHNAVRRLYPRRDGRNSVSHIDLSSLLQKRHPPLSPEQQKSPGKKVEVEQEQELRAESESAFANPKILLPPQPVFLDRNKLDILAKPSPLPFAGPTMSTDSGMQEDSELYVISNSALDDEILQKIKGKNLKSFEIKLHRLAGEAMLQQKLRRRNLSTSELHQSRPQLSRAALTNLNLLEAAALLRQLREASRRAAEGQQGASQRARLRVAASVAQLLAQAREQQLQLAREHMARGSAEANSPAVVQQLRLARERQLRIAAEVGDAQRPSNPVPGTSESPPSPEEPSSASESQETGESEVASGCPEDASQDSSSSGVYDNFLEATGLSQKSIMTPSRMLNNHRNVIKPKDVKLRNKVRNAAIFERNIPPQVVGPTVKYWTEPFL